MPGFNPLDKKDKWHTTTLPGTPRPRNKTIGNEFALSIDTENISVTNKSQNQSISPNLPQPKPQLGKNPALAKGRQTIANAAISEEEKDKLNETLNKIEDALKKSNVNIKNPPGAKVDPATGTITITFNSADDLIKFLKAMGIQLTPDQEKNLRDPNYNKPISFKNPTPGKRNSNEQLQDILPDNQPKPKPSIAQDTSMAKPISSPTNPQLDTTANQQPSTAPTPFHNRPKPY